jgi:hypothetical protein
MVNYLLVGIVFVGIIFLLFFYFFIKTFFKREFNLNPRILVSRNKNVKFIYPKKKDSSKFNKPKKIYVPVDSEVYELFHRDYKKKYDLNLDNSSEKESLNDLESKNRDIPLVKNTLREIGLFQKHVSFQGVSESRGLVPLSPYNHGKKGNGEIFGKKVYCIFYRNLDISLFSDILKKYGLGIYKFGDLRFSILNSSKNPENKLIRLAKKIVAETNNKDLLLHLVKFRDREKLSKLFGLIRDVLKEGEGLLISEGIFDRIDNQREFVFFKTIADKDKKLKLYRLS